MHTHSWGLPPTTEHGLPAARVVRFKRESLFARAMTKVCCHIVFKHCKQQNTTSSKGTSNSGAVVARFHVSGAACLIMRVAARTPLLRDVTAGAFYSGLLAPQHVCQHFHSRKLPCRAEHPPASSTIPAPALGPAPHCSWASRPAATSQRHQAPLMHGVRDTPLRSCCFSTHTSGLRSRTVSPHLQRARCVEIPQFLPTIYTISSMIGWF